MSAQTWGLSLSAPRPVPGEREALACLQPLAVFNMHSCLLFHLSLTQSQGLSLGKGSGTTRVTKSPSHRAFASGLPMGWELGPQDSRKWEKMELSTAGGRQEVPVKLVEQPPT